MTELLERVETDHVEDEPVRRPGRRLSQVGALVALVVAQGVLATGLDLGLLGAAVALVTLLGVPTVVLARRARLPLDTGAARWLLAFGASLLGVIVVGLAVNTVLPLLGDDRPLRPLVLAIAWLVIDATLLLWRSDVPLVASYAVRPALRCALAARLEPAQALAVLAVVAAVAGAVRLNNGAGGQVAIVGQLLAAAALLALMLRREGTLGRDVRVVALAAAALLLATSLRGWVVVGHDIQAEYLAFHLTDGAQHWQMSALQNAYNACLSVTILPTVLAQLTGLSGVVVFKVLLQLVFVLVPVSTYLLSRKYLSRRLSLVATTLTMAFPTFFTDMPYLVRQEVAFFFLALLLLVVADRSLPQATARRLVVVLGVGVVLSHYSTTYLMLMGAVLALVALGVGTLLARRWKRLEPLVGGTSGLVLLHPMVVALLVAASLAWAGPVTHTGAHAKDVVRTTIAALTGGGASGPGSSDTSYRLFAGNEPTARERLDDFVDQTLEYRQERFSPREMVVRDPGPAETRPEVVEPHTAPATAIGRALDSVGLDPVTVNKAARVGAAALMQVLLLLGLLWLLRRRRGEEDRAVPREVAWLSVGAVGALGLVVVVPNLSVDYGVLRVFQQTLLLTAPLLAAGLGMAVRLLGGRMRWLVVATPVVLLLVLGGVLPAFVGGQQPRLALSNSGSYHDRFYTSDSEAQAIDWLAVTDGATGYRSKIVANRNVMVKMLAATGNAAPIADRLYPTLLTRDAYVFADSQMVEQGTSTIFWTGDLITYRYPVRVLERRMDLVYSSPGAKVYR